MKENAAKKKREKLPANYIGRERREGKREKAKSQVVRAVAGSPRDPHSPCLFASGQAQVKGEFFSSLSLSLSLLLF